MKNLLGTYLKYEQNLKNILFSFTVPSTFRGRPLVLGQNSFLFDVELPLGRPCIPVKIFRGRPRPRFFNGMNSGSEEFVSCCVEPNVYFLGCPRPLFPGAGELRFSINLKSEINTINRKFQSRSLRNVVRFELTIVKLSIHAHKNVFIILAKSESINWNWNETFNSWIFKF